MSTEQVDPHVLEQTKAQIRALVNEIAQLSQTAIAPQEFYAEFLGRVVSALAAVGGAVWVLNEQGTLSLQYQVNLPETRLPALDERDQRRHGQMLGRFIASGQGGLVQPHSAGADENEGANPTDCLLVVGPLRTDIAVVGLVEIFQRSDTPAATQNGYLRFVLQMCGLAGNFLKSHQLRRFTDRQSLWTQLENFTQVIHATLDPRETAYTIANEARRLIDCDRVSVALKQGNRCAVEAISGQDVIDKRSNVVRLLGKLATEVVKADEPLWFTGDTRDLAPQVEAAVGEYVDESHSKTVAVLPLKRPEPDAEQEKEDRKFEAQEPFGALIIEQIEEAKISELTLQRINVVARHSASALGNAVEHHSLFLMPVWRAVGRSAWVLKARTLPKTVSIALGFLALLVALVVVPWDFELHAKGTLEPLNRRDVFAGIDGTVDKVFVSNGDTVKAQQPLVLLRNTELGVAMTEVIGQRTTTSQRIRSLERSLLEQNRLSVEERNQKAGELAEARQKLSNLDEQYQLYLLKQKELDVKSPMAGKVVTWDVYNRLIQRPVQRGQVLMRVADPEGPWQLELRMADDRMGYIARAQNEMGPNLRVTYLVASDPGSKHVGTVREVQLSSEVRDESGSTVLIKVDIDKNDLGELLLRPGTTVTAKVYCGRRSVGYVIFHDVLAFLQSRVFFPLF